jgi:predicted GNAT family acetyltransferase
MEQLINNTKQKRFEIKVEGIVAYIEYLLDDDWITLVHTYVPEEARGLRLASELAKQVLEYIKEAKLKLVVLCPFIKKYISKHPEYAGLVSMEIKD